MIEYSNRNRSFLKFILILYHLLYKDKTPNAPLICTCDLHNNGHPTKAQEGSFEILGITRKKRDSKLEIQNAQDSHFEIQYLN